MLISIDIISLHAEMTDIGQRPGVRKGCTPIRDLNSKTQCKRLVHSIVLPAVDRFKRKSDMKAAAAESFNRLLKRGMWLNCTRDETGPIVK